MNNKVAGFGLALLVGLSMLTRVAFAEEVASQSPLSSTVVIRSESGLDTSIAAGVVIGISGKHVTIATVAHILRAGRIQVSLRDGLLFSVSEKHVAPTDDIAYIVVSLPAYEVETIRPAILSASFAIDDGVEVVGHPNAVLFQTLHGVIRYVSREPSFIVDCADCTFGNSGGGVFDARGHLLAIVTGKGPITMEGGGSIAGGRSFTFSTSVERIKAVMPSMLENVQYASATPGESK